MDDARAGLTRRNVLGRAAGGLGALSLTGLLAACGDSSKPAATTAGGKPQLSGDMKIWWWGEQEAPGLQKWMDQTTRAFSAETGVNVDATLMDTANVISQFTDAAAAKSPPDVQFLWNGHYHMENVWRGFLKPLEGVIDQRVLDASNPTKLSFYEGKVYRVGWYAAGVGIAYNKTILDKVGGDPDAFPNDWDGFMDLSDKIKGRGIAPFGGGVKDGPFGEFWLAVALTQALDTPADALNLFIGEEDWRQPQFWEFWAKLRDLRDGGYLNDDIGSIELYQGQQKFDTGKIAMTPTTATTVHTSEKRLGAGNVGFAPLPTFGTGVMAGKPITEVQGLGIPTDAKNPDAAAAFIEFALAPAQLKAMWTQAKQIPASSDFDGSVIDDPTLAEIYRTYVASDDHVAYIPAMMPTLFWTDAMFVAAQKILAGEMSGEQAGELSAKVTDKWKKQNPQMVENYRTWAADVA